MTLLNSSEPRFAYGRREPSHRHLSLHLVPITDLFFTLRPYFFNVHFFRPFYSLYSCAVILERKKSSLSPSPFYICLLEKSCRSPRVLPSQRPPSFSPSLSLPCSHPDSPNYRRVTQREASQQRNYISASITHTTLGMDYI